MHFRTAGHQVRILLLRTRVGHEMPAGDGEGMRAKRGIVQELLQACSVGTGSVRVYFTMGTFDLMLVVSGEAARRGLQSYGTIDGILAATEVFCDALVVCEDDDRDPLRGMIDADLMSLTVLRLVPSVTRESGRPAERDFLQHWERKRSDPSLSHLFHPSHDVLLLTQGGPQLLVLANHRDLEDFEKWILEALSGTDVLSTTHTLLGFSHRLLEAALAPEPATPAPSVGLLPEGTQVHLQVSWAGGAAMEVVALAKEFFDRPLSFRTGSKDLTVHLHPRADPPEELPLFTVLEEIIRFRSIVRDRARSTTTRLLLPPHPRMLVTPGRQYRPGARIRLEITAAQARSILDRAPHIGPKVLEYLYYFSDIAEDDDVTDDICDAVPYWCAVRDAALVEDPDERELAERLHFAREGLKQRLLGHRGPVHGAVTDMPQPLGGVNKILQAALSIPMHVTSRLEGEEWDPSHCGLVNVGPYRDYKARAHFVVTLPESFLYQPNRWARLVHEAGHWYYHRHRRDVDLVRLRAEVLRDFHHFDDDAQDTLFEELVADLIDIHFAPHWEAGLWFREFWHSVWSTSSHSPDPLDGLWLRPTIVRAVLDAGGHRPSAPMSELRLDRAYEALRVDYARWRDAASRAGCTEQVAALELAIREHARADREEPSYSLSVLLDPRYPISRGVSRAVASFRRRLPCADEEARRRLWSAIDLDRILAPEHLYDPEAAREIEDPVLFLWKLWERWSAEDLPVSERNVAVSLLALKSRAHLAEFLTRAGLTARG